MCLPILFYFKFQTLYVEREFLFATLPFHSLQINRNFNLIYCFVILEYCYSNACSSYSANYVFRRLLDTMKIKSLPLNKIIFISFFFLYCLCLPQICQTIASRICLACVCVCVGSLEQLGWLALTFDFDCFNH